MGVVPDLKRAQERSLHREVLMSPSKIYPEHLHHKLPSWVSASDKIFHIRIRGAENNPVPLADQNLKHTSIEWRS